MATTLYLNADFKEHIDQASSLLREGRLVAFPTETVYGLGALAFDESSVKKVFKAKKRPKSNPLIVHVGVPEKAMELFDFDGSKNSQRFKSRMQVLCDRFWPGPLTIVGKKKGVISDLVTAGFPKVALRSPSHPVAKEILTRVDAPIVAPSANPFTRPSPTTSKHVQYGLDGVLDAILDGGPSEFGIESTVIDIDDDHPRILRHGVIGLKEIEKALDEPCFTLKKLKKTNEFASPGLTIRHYSPAIEKVALASKKDLARAWFSSSAIILRRDSEAQLSQQLGKRAKENGALRVLPDDPKGYAKELFAAFYEMESIGPNTLLVESLEELSCDSEWLAIRDKLARAQNFIS